MVLPLISVELASVQNHEDVGLHTSYFVIACSSYAGETIPFGDTEVNEIFRATCNFQG
jgi:hypothetical protein